MNYINHMKADVEKRRAAGDITDQEAVRELTIIADQADAVLAKMKARTAAPVEQPLPSAQYVATVKQQAAQGDIGAEMHVARMQENQVEGW